TSGNSYTATASYNASAAETVTTTGSGQFSQETYLAGVFSNGWYNLTSVALTQSRSGTQTQNGSQSSSYSGGKSILSTGTGMPMMSTSFGGINGTLMGQTTSTQTFTDTFSGSASGTWNQTTTTTASLSERGTFGQGTMGFAPFAFSSV